MKKNKSDVRKILESIAPKIGAKILREPKWESVYQIKFKNGRKFYSHSNKLDINPMGASEIARDKGYAKFFMKNMGYPTIEGKTFYSKLWARTINSKDDIDRAFLYAKYIGFPVVVKPNSKSQGLEVSVVHNKTEFCKALKQIFKYDRVALVERYISGNDYRIVVLGDKIISAYKRTPVCILGDGKSTISKLLREKKKYFKSINRDIKIDENDIRIKNKLKRQKLKLSSIAKKGDKVYLLDNANLSQGGDSLDVTNKIHPMFEKIAIRLTRDMGLDLCGVDLMIVGNINDKPQKFWIIEVNSAPGLDHYVTLGKAQKKIVEDMYLKVLKNIEKS